MSKSSADSGNKIKLICYRPGCKEYGRVTYRTFNSLKDQICSSCHSTLSRPTNKSLLRSDIKARLELQSLAVEDNNV